MANPQTEDGYTMIANELLAALSWSNLSGPEFMVALTVISKTYGWKRKEAQVSLTDFQVATRMTRTRVIRALKVLVRQGVLGSIVGSTSKAATYWINKDYEQWQTSPSIMRGTSLPRIVHDTSSSIVHDTTPSIICVAQDTILRNSIITVKKLKERKERKTPSPEAQAVFAYFCLKNNKKILLDSVRLGIIQGRLKEGRTVIEMKHAIDAFAKDIWEDRHKFCDIIYCLGTRNKINNLDKWLSVTPMDQPQGGGYSV